MAVLCEMPTIQYSAWSVRLPVHKLLTSSIMPSVTYLQLSDVSIIYRVTYLQFPIQKCFSSMSVRQVAQPLTSQSKLTLTVTLTLTNTVTLTSQTKLTENNRKQTKNNPLIFGCFGV